MATKEETTISGSDEEIIEKRNERRMFALKAGFFLGGVTLVSAVAGFSTTVASVKKREQEVMAAAGFSPEKIASIVNREEGVRLAIRALGYGSLLAVTGVSLIAYLGWKLSGASNFEEFRLKMGSVLPKIPKSEQPGRSEFNSLNDFLDYISSTSKPT